MCFRKNVLQSTDRLQQSFQIWLLWLANLQCGLHVFVSCDRKSSVPSYLSDCSIFCSWKLCKMAQLPYLDWTLITPECDKVVRVDNLGKIDSVIPGFKNFYFTLERCINLNGFCMTPPPLLCSQKQRGSGSSWRIGPPSPPGPGIGHQCPAECVRRTGQFVPCP